MERLQSSHSGELRLCETAAFMVASWFVPFKNVAEVQCLESGILQTAGGIVTATVKRSIMLSTAEKEAPCSCSQDKSVPLLSLSSYS